MQFQLPAASVYFPAGHALHDAAEMAPMTNENVPALHGVQSVTASLPSVSMYVPAWQSWHASAREAPVASLYLPLAHKLQEEMETAP